MEYKYFKAKFNVSDEDEDKGMFTGYASIWDIVDSYGDVVERGAFKKTLKENKHFPILWSHDIFQPMGITHGQEDDKGLAVEGHLNLDVQLAREKRSLMIQEAINGISIGFQTMKEIQDKETGTRHLKEIKLWEISPCVFQACPGAVIGEVKSLELKPYPNEHSARLKDPDDFDADSFRRKADGTIYGKIKVPATADVIWGKLKGASAADDMPIPQAIRFPKKDWTAAEAKAWLKDNEVKYIDFEPASKSLESVIESIRAVKPEGLKTDSKALLYEARLSINALLGKWEPESTPGTGESLDLGKPEFLRLLDGWELAIEQARQNL